MREDKPGRILYNCSNTKEAFERKKERAEYFKKFRRSNRSFYIIITILSFLITIGLIEYGIIYVILGFSCFLVVLYFGHRVIFKPRELMRKWESEYDFIIYENGLLLPNQTFEPQKSVFVSKERIFKIYWNRGHHYLLLIFNEPPRIENKLNRRFQVFPKRYIDNHKQCLDILEKYYGVNKSEILLREDVIIDKRYRKSHNAYKK